MNRPPPRPPRRPYWLLFVLAGLLLAPPAWAVAALIGVAITATVASAVRDARHRRAVAGGAAARGEALALGRDAQGRTVEIADRQLSAHGLIVGASGAGKSTTLLTLLTDQIRRGRPVVAIDMKGSPAFAQELARAAAQAGRPFRLWTLDGPTRWNPLAHGNATELKDKLIATERFTEPHYQRAAERYVQTVLQVLGEARPQAAIELDEVVRLMEPARLSAMLRELPRGRAEQVHDYLAGMTPDQLSAVRGLGTRLAILSESHTGRFLSSEGDLPPIDLRRALEGDEVVLFGLNSSTYGKLAAQVGTLAIQDLVAAAGHRLGNPGQRAMIGIDEFSALDADHVVNLFARGREAGFTVFLATQELADLDRAARGLRAQVVGNTAIKFVHRQDVPASAHAVAEMIGTEKRWDVTHSLGGFGRRSGGGSMRLVEQFVIHPNQIMSLRTGQAVVITKLPFADVRIVQVRAPDRGGAAVAEAGAAQPSTVPAPERGERGNRSPRGRRGIPARDGRPGRGRAPGPPRRDGPSLG
jgi:conjugal transfer pilus assembly protein TraD